MDEGRSLAGWTSDVRRAAQMKGTPVPVDFDTMAARFNRQHGLQARYDTMMELRRQGEAAKPLLFAGLEHPAWRVRYVCLRVLDHTIVDDETRIRVLGALKDPHRKVRRAAVHLLGCEPCKPEGFCGIEGIDIDELYLDVVENDRSALVRRYAVALFMYKSELPESVAGRLRRALSRETNDAVRIRLAGALLWPEIYGDGRSRYVDRLDEYKRRVGELLVDAPAA